MTTLQLHRLFRGMQAIAERLANAPDETRLGPRCNELEQYFGILLDPTLHNAGDQAAIERFFRRLTAERYAGLDYFYLYSARMEDITGKHIKDFRVTLQRVARGDLNYRVLDDLQDLIHPLCRATLAQQGGGFLGAPAQKPDFETRLGRPRFGVIDGGRTYTSPRPG